MRARGLVSSVSLLVLCALLISCTQMDVSPNVDPDLAPAESALDGTAWVLASLNGEPLLEGTVITLEFGDGTLGGQSGCNTYGGTYVLTGTELTLRGVSSTLMGCDAPVMEQEGAYFRALGEAATYTLTGERLELVNRESGATLGFTRN
jgi:heat shock protein HslJ